MGVPLDHGLRRYWCHGVQVLSKWDFSRKLSHDTMDVMGKAMSAYESEEKVWKEYLRSRRWETYKKSLVDSIVAARDARRYKRRL